MLSMKDAILQRALRGVAQGDFDLSRYSDIQNLFNQLRNYRSKLPVGHVLKEAVLPDEISPSQPIRRRRRPKAQKLSAEI